MLNNQNKSKGFTLVEVIVVAVIVAILAGVSVPLYLGYVNNSRSNAAANTSGAVASFMGACINQAGTVTGTPAVTAGTATAAATTLTCAVAGGGAGATIAIPADIHVTISNLTGTGNVSATHASSPNGTAPSVFNY